MIIRRREMNYFLPEEIVENNIKSGVKKTGLPIYKMILLGILSGMFIGFGSEASSLAVHNISDVGLSRTLMGVIFPVGLMMIVIMGCELFTGNCTIFMAVMDKKVKLRAMLKNLIVVYISNLFGSVLIAFMVYMSGQWNYSDNALGAFTIKVAYGKVNLSFSQTVFSAILCNILVCMAVLMAASAKDIVGKCITIFFAIMAFVVSGFEHCVANMYYLSAGFIASKNSDYLEKAAELYGMNSDKISDSLSIGNLFTANLLPVTLGNLIGGIVFISVPLYLVYIKGKKGE